MKGDISLAMVVKNLKKNMIINAAPLQVNISLQFNTI